MEQDKLDVIEKTAEEFFNKMTVVFSTIEAGSSEDIKEDGVEVVDLNIKLEEPQILIGQGGQTLFEIQRLLRMVLNKKLENVFFLNLDINGYKKQKVEYLKDLAKELANQVTTTKQEKVLLPMSSYERRIIHAELAQRTDITTESQGEGFDRHIVIKAL